MARILVIEDDPFVRTMIREILEADGHDLSTAEDGVAGCALLQVESFDLLITDIVMPNQDGLETILATRREQPELPILAISGGGRYEWTDVLESAELFGATRTLTKPFAVEALVTCVHELLEGAVHASFERGRAA